MQGLIGKKIGMTRIFDSESGEVIPVTVVEASANVIQQVKTVEKDGYSAVQLGYGILPERKATKSAIGHAKKYSAEPARYLKEFKLDSADEKLEAGQSVGVELFNDVDYVDVSGVMKGRGYAGTVKRYNFHIGRATHGNTNRRDRGSIGACSYPAKVIPGLKMAGQYGNTNVTTKGIRIVGLDKESGLVYLEGSVPGRNKGIVYLKKNLVKR